MQAEKPAGTAVSLYLAAVTGLAATSIFLLYQLHSVAVPAGFTAFVEDPGTTVTDSPAGVALVLATAVVILLLVSIVVLFGVRVTNVEEPRDHGNDG